MTRHEENVKLTLIVTQPTHFHTNQRLYSQNVLYQFNNTCNINQKLINLIVGQYIYSSTESKYLSTKTSQPAKKILWQFPCAPYI